MGEIPAVMVGGRGKRLESACYLDRVARAFRTWSEFLKQYA